MGQSKRITFMYFFAKIVGCNLEDENVKVFTRCTWKNLELLDFRFNKANDGSIDYLSHSNWSKLNEIILCKFLII